MTKMPLPPRRSEATAKRFTVRVGDRIEAPNGSFDVIRETGTLVGVRLQRHLLARLDKTRGGLTRPQKIRAILEKELPE